MAVEYTYTLELFPTSEESYAMYLGWLGGRESVDLDGENAGFDLATAKEQKVVQGSMATLLDLGVKARMVRCWRNYIADSNSKEYTAPSHFWLAPRSSIWKNGVRQANSIGVIDRCYRGVLMGAVLTNSAYDVTIPTNTRLFQVLAPDMGHISRVVLKPLSELDSTSRGEGGFGSSGL
jgi:dUTPase